MASPNAPILTYPGAGDVINASEANTLTWVFSDDDAGDTQSAYNVYYQTAAAGASNTGKTVSTNEYHQFAASTFTTAGWHYWYVITWDQGDNEGEASAAKFFYVVLDVATPVITAPADAGTVTDNSEAITWTHADQDGFQARRVADSGGSPDTGTVYEDSGIVVEPNTRSYTFTPTVDDRDEHWQVRVFSGSGTQRVWSDWDSHKITMNVVAPDTPTLTATAGGAGGSGDYITVDPTPGDESDPPPIVATFDIWRTEDSESASDAIRIATDIDDDASFIDRNVVPGKTYRYIARAVAETTATVTDSALTA